MHRVIMPLDNRCEERSKGFFYVLIAKKMNVACPILEIHSFYNCNEYANRNI